MAAGLGFKTFTTGEVLTAADTNGYLMQGVLVFASAAARDAAITSPQEGQCCYLKDTDAVLTYSGAAWVGFDDSNAIQNSIVDAKGDLVAASGADTPARLAVGNNGETLVADSSTSTGLRYNPPVGSLANPTINGGMDVWQRGTSISVAASQSGVYTADRWQISTGANQACTISRQTVSDSTNLPNIQYSLRHQRNSGQTGTTQLPLVQSFETINSIPFAGKTVTLSFYARCGANFSPTSGAFTVYLVTGTGTDQNRLTTVYTGDNTSITAVPNATTTWQRFVVSGTIPSTATEISVYYIWAPTGTAGANDWIEITGVQIDVGTYTATTAPTFRRSQGTIQGELAACQRYYFRFDIQAINTFGFGFASSTTNGTFAIPFPVPLRTAATALEQSGTTTDYTVTNAAGNQAAASVPTFGSASKYNSTINCATSSLTSGEGVRLRGATTAAYLAWSAEL